MNGFDFRTAKEIDIGIARALCMRITYVGELGYELFIPAEQATYVYNRIVEEGQDFDLKHAGLKALGSLRMVRLFEFACLVHLVGEAQPLTFVVRLDPTGKRLQRLWS